MNIDVRGRHVPHATCVSAADADLDPEMYCAKILNFHDAFVHARDANSSRAWKIFKKRYAPVLETCVRTHTVARIGAFCRTIGLPNLVAARGEIEAIRTLIHMFEDDDAETYVRLWEN